MGKQLKDDSNVKESPVSHQEAAQLLRMGVHVPRCEAKWLCEVGAEYKSRPEERVADGCSLGISMPPEFLALADLYMDCMLVALLSPSIVAENFTDMVIECNLYSHPSPRDDQVDLTLCFSVFTLPGNEPLDSKHNGFVLAMFKYAALHKEIQTADPLLVSEAFHYECEGDSPGAFIMHYPGFIRVGLSPFLLLTPPGEWPKLSVRVPINQVVLQKAKAVRDFLLLHDKPAALYKRVEPI